MSIRATIPREHFLLFVLQGLGFCWLPSLLLAESPPPPRTTPPAVSAVPLPAAGAVLKPTPAGAAITARDVRPHVYYLASPELRGRGDFPSRAVAANYIVDQFRALKLEPVFDQRSYSQDVPGPRGEDGRSPVIGRNLGAWLPGSDPQLRNEFVIFSAHYDHLGEQRGQIYAGADDNAAAVAMLLEVARQLSRPGQAPRRSVMFISFDLEERMLWGSTWFVAHLPRKREQIKLFITADLIGRSLGDLPIHRLFIMGGERGTDLKPLVRSITPPRSLQVTQLGADLVGTLSDYGPFRDDKIPFLFFSCGRHADYHTPRDTPDRVDYEQVADISNVALTVTQTAANASRTPQWIETPTTDLEEFDALYKLTTLVLNHDDQAHATGGRTLPGLQRQFLESIQQYARSVLKSRKISESDRGWLRRSTQFLLATVF